MTQAQDTRYFDLHINGIGYLNRIREVKPRKGDAFMACDIAALSGSTDDVAYTRFDCRVSGGQAAKLVRRCIEAVETSRKVLIGFRLGDLWTDVFVYQRGDKKGETGVSLKARLLYIGFIKIDGETAYKADTNGQGQDSQGKEGNSKPASGAVA